MSIKTKLCYSIQREREGEGERETAKTTENLLTNSLFSLIIYVLFFFSLVKMINLTTRLLRLLCLISEKLSTVLTTHAAKKTNKYFALIPNNTFAKVFIVILFY